MNNKFTTIFHFLDKKYFSKVSEYFILSLEFKKSLQEKKNFSEYNFLLKVKFVFEKFYSCRTQSIYNLLKRNHMLINNKNYDLNIFKSNFMLHSILRTYYILPLSKNKRDFFIQNRRQISLVTNIKWMKEFSDIVALLIYNYTHNENKKFIYNIEEKCWNKRIIDYIKKIEKIDFDYLKQGNIIVELQAALWCLFNTNTFIEGLKKVLKLNYNTILIYAMLGCCYYEDISVKETRHLINNISYSNV
jgi:hypothetical protein